MDFRMDAIRVWSDWELERLHEDIIVEMKENPHNGQPCQLSAPFFSILRKLVIRRRGWNSEAQGIILMTELHQYKRDWFKLRECASFLIQSRNRTSRHGPKLSTEEKDLHLAAPSECPENPKRSRDSRFHSVDLANHQSFQYWAIRSGTTNKARSQESMRLIA